MIVLHDAVDIEISLTCEFGDGRVSPASGDDVLILIAVTPSLPQEQQIGNATGVRITSCAQSLRHY